MVFAVHDSFGSDGNIVAEDGGVHAAFEAAVGHGADGDAGDGVGDYDVGAAHVEFEAVEEGGFVGGEDAGAVHGPAFVHDVHEVGGLGGGWRWGCVGGGGYCVIFAVVVVFRGGVGCRCCGRGWGVLVKRLFKRLGHGCIDFLVVGSHCCGWGWRAEFSGKHVGEKGLWRMETKW